MDVAELRVLLTAQNDASPEMQKAAGDLEDVGKAAKDAGGSAEAGGGGFLSLGTKLLPIAAGVAGVGAALGGMISNASEAQDVTAQLDAAIASTGGKAGITRDQILDLSSSLSAASGLSKFGDEAIASADTLLLKFQNIGGEVFPQATQAIVDMATRMGSDPVSAATSLGRALDNPTKGLAMLARQGVSFTDDQKKLVASLQETGDMAGAQKVILDQLNATYGGAAAASADTFSGKMATLQDRFGEVLESLGTALLPLITQFVDFLGSPEVMGAIEGLGNILVTGIGNGIQFVGSVIQAVQPFLQPFIDMFMGFVTAVQGGASPLEALGAQLQNIGPAFQNLATGFLSWVGELIPQLLAKLGELIGAIGAWIVENGPAIAAQLGQWAQAFITWAGEMIPQLLGKLGELIGQIMGWIGANGPGIMAQLGTWTQTFLQWIVDMIPQVLAGLGNLINGIFQWIGENGPGILAQLGQWALAFVEWVGPQIPVLLGKLMELLGAVLQWLADNLPSIVGKLLEWGLAFIQWVGPQIPVLLGKLGELIVSLLQWLADQVPGIVAKLGEWAGAFLNWVGTSVLPFIGEKLAEFGTAVWNWITTTAGDLLTKAGELGKSLIDGIVNKIHEMWTNLTQFGTDLLNFIIGLPAKVLGAVVDLGKSIIDGIVQGLKNAGDAIWNFIKGLLDGMVDGIKAFFGISSPSKLMADIGEDVGMGLGIGIGNTTADVVAQTQKLADEVAGVPFTLGGALGDVAANGGRATGPGDAFSATPLLAGSLGSALDAAAITPGGELGTTMVNPVFVNGKLAFSSVPDDIHGFFVDVERHKNGVNGGPKIGVLE